jgi:2-polyprenyl-3-methyl-5-hydroxy-6-metoxy-1,4-benzoquinol methylase
MESKVVGLLSKLKRGLRKLTVDPLKYGRGDDYDSARYWQDRFERYGSSFRGAGDESLPAAENERMYAEASSLLLGLAERIGVCWPEVSVLEVGLGNGYYTRLLHEQGVARYLGVDIVETFMPTLAGIDSSFVFRKLDVATSKIPGTYDVILMIDVIEHIVKRAKFEYAMNNLFEALNGGATLFINPLQRGPSRRRMFYLASWGYDDLKVLFPGCSFSQLIPFRGGNLVVIRKGTYDLGNVYTAS